MMSSYKFSLCRLELVVCRDFIFDSIQGEFILLYANRLISQSLTPELIQQQMYEKWNGQLPTVQSGSDTPIIVDTTN